ncbi:MAG: hypothetical protein IK014_11000 [Lachnospiraceae bacterium]|nr:hypothetical protein [Lachnospiraceae bacterium]
MGKILKMDFRRLLKNPFFYAYPFAAIVIVGLDMIISESGTDRSIHIVSVLQQAEGVFGFAIVAAGMVIIAHMAAFDKHGYSKNLVGNVNGRHMLTLSKLILGAFTMVTYAIANFCLIFGILKHEMGNITFISEYPYPESAELLPESLRKNWESREEWTARIKEYINHEVLHYVIMIVAGIAVIAMLIMLYELTRSSAFSYVMVILIGFEILEQLIVMVVGLVFPNFAISRYLFMTQFAYFNEQTFLDSSKDLAADPVWTFWVRNLIYIAIFAGASLFISKKKDAA